MVITDIQRTELIDGEIVEFGGGDKLWYNKNNQLHRLDGPAVEYADGSNEWYVNGRKHRLDGPAIDYSDGTKAWYYHDDEISCNSNSEFIRIVNMKAFW